MDAQARVAFLQEIQDSAKAERYPWAPHEKKAMEGQTTWVWVCAGDRRVEVTVGGPLVHVHFIGTAEEGQESENSGPSTPYAKKLGHDIAVFAATATAANAELP
jgi:hypothetical protein